MAILHSGNLTCQAEPTSSEEVGPTAGARSSGRGAGKHGGHGNAGLHKHKVMYMLKYMPDHFGRHGFKRPQKMVSAKITLNVGDIDEKLERAHEGWLRREDRTTSMDQPH